LLADGIDNPGVRINLAICRHILGDHLGTTEALMPLYTAGIHDFNIIRLLVSSLHHLGRMNEAMDIVKNNSQAGNDGPTAGVFALLCLDAEDRQGAAHWAALALTANPDSVDGLITQATLSAAELDSKSAAPQFRRVLELAPTNGRAWVGLGMLAMLEQNFDESRDCLEKGLQELSEHLGTWLVLGWNHLLTGNLAEAKRILLHALELDRTFSETHGALAAIEALQGNRADAQRLISTALRLNSACLSAQYAQAVLDSGAGNSAAARQRILRAATSLGIKTAVPASQLPGKEKKDQ
jgi:tetratricopeptide (TPR) repeat protein